MTKGAKPANAARDLRRPATLVAALLCLVACGADPPDPVAPTATPAVAEPDVAARASAPAPARLPVTDPVSSSPMPPVSPDDVEFVGWFIEQGGSSQLLACGQSMALPIANPSFLRELGGKLNRRGNAPVYVHLRVRLAAGSRLEVTEVLQFGVDEAPVVDCPLDQ